MPNTASDRRWETHGRQQSFWKQFLRVCGSKGWRKHIMRQKRSIRKKNKQDDPEQREQSGTKREQDSDFYPFSM